MLTNNDKKQLKVILKNKLDKIGQNKTKHNFIIFDFFLAKPSLIDCNILDSLRLEKSIKCVISLEHSKSLDTPKKPYPHDSLPNLREYIHINYFEHKLNLNVIYNLSLGVIEERFKQYNTNLNSV